MPAFFVPARNTRHRTACFALYKVLLRQGGRVPLPDDVATGFGPVNPIKHLVRATFRRNKSDTSPRLVVSALKNGYKFLDLLTAAEAPSSPQNDSIVSFLKSRLVARQAAAPPRPQRTTALHPDRVPLLKLVAPATRGKPPVYAPTARPLPLSKLSGGVRKVPSLDEANGIPFLRIRKPESHGLSRVIRQKLHKRQWRITRVIKLKEADTAEAAWEDDWDKAVNDLLPRQRGREAGGLRGGGDTFGQAVRKNITHLTTMLEAERVDRIARGKAMWNIVEAETALAEKERQEKGSQGPKGTPHAQAKAPRHI